MYCHLDWLMPQRLSNDSWTMFLQKNLMYLQWYILMIYWFSWKMNTTMQNTCVRCLLNCVNTSWKRNAKRVHLVLQNCSILATSWKLNHIHGSVKNWRNYQVACTHYSQRTADVPRSVQLLCQVRKTFCDHSCTITQPAMEGITMEMGNRGESCIRGAERCTR